MVLFCLPWEVGTIRWLPLQLRDSMQKHFEKSHQFCPSWPCHLLGIQSSHILPCYPSRWPSLYKTSSVIWWSCVGKGANNWKVAKMHHSKGYRFVWCWARLMIFIIFILHFWNTFLDGGIPFPVEGSKKPAKCDVPRRIVTMRPAATTS